VSGSSPSGADEGKSSGRRGARRPLTTEAIVAVAVRIADAEGLEAVSIRRIAAELDGRPMSFYDHFASKHEMLSWMADEVVSEVLVPDPAPEPWREAMTTISRRVYAMLVRHPWVVSVSSINPRFGPNTEAQATQYVVAMSSLGLEPAAMWALVGTINDYVLGHSLRVTRLARPEKFDEIIAESTLEAVPELAALPVYLQTRALVERFESGLAIVLDGIEKRLPAEG
jgi:AcrR family transcriptional regulator